MRSGSPMTPRLPTVLAIAGFVMLALASVALVPMLEEAVALAAAERRYRIERLDTVAAAGDTVAYRCGGRRVALSDDAPVDPPGDGPTRYPVTVRIGDSALTTVPVSIHADRTGPNRYWGRVAPFRWTDRETGAAECGVVYRLPSDTAAIARARAERGSYLLRTLLGARSAWQHGLRFRVIRWSAGEETVQAQDFGFGDWDGDPYGVYAANQLGTPIGLRNQSLYFWPTLLWPVLYPFGVAALGLLLLVAGLAWRYRARR